MRHGDKTSWRVQATDDCGHSSRGWLWAGLSADSVCFHIDPSRSAEAAKVLFGDTICPMVRVCYRDSAYQRLAKDLGGHIILQECWAHQRRDVTAGAAGRKALHDWLEAWLARFAVIFQLNQQRLNHYNPCSNQQTALFQAAHAELVQASHAVTSPPLRA